MSTDPFQTAQSEILTLLSASRAQLSSYLRIRSSASSPTSPELTEALHELEATLTDLSADLQDLVDSVNAVESDPRRYGLDHAEVARRRKVVVDVGREVEGMRVRLNEGVELADAERKLAHPDHFVNVDGDEDLLTGQHVTNDDADDDDYGQWEEQRQMEMMHEQDEALDGVFQTVGNLRLQADTMGRELEEQAEMLEGVDEITDRVGGKLAVGVKRIRGVLESGEGELILIIVFVCC